MRVFFGIDKVILTTLGSRVVNVVAGLTTLFFITQTLSVEMQGYYYTFNSLIALQIFAELGLNFALVQISSHEMAGLSWQSDGTLSGQAKSKRRLQSILHFALIWFSFAAILMIIFLCPFGIYFFAKSDSYSSLSVSANFNINIPWILIVILTAISVFLSAASAILEGCGRVTSVATMRLWQSLLAPCSACLILHFEGGLYSLVGASLTSVLTGFIWLWINYRVFFKDLVNNRIEEPGMNWKTEVWPFQWRIAVSWISGYFGMQLFIPMLFEAQGPSVAGQLGMTLQLINALNGVAIIWISTKAPAFGSLIASNERNKLDELFLTSFLQSVFILLVGLFILMSAIIYLSATNSPFAARVISYEYLFIFCGISLANHIVQSEAIFLRAHKEEPFMIISIMGGLITLILSIILIPKFGLLGATITYGTSTLIFGLIGGTLIFYKQRKKWSVRDKDK